jgi:hypothetical protein
MSVSDTDPEGDRLVLELSELLAVIQSIGMNESRLAHQPCRDCAALAIFPDAAVPIRCWSWSTARRAMWKPSECRNPTGQACRTETVLPPPAPKNIWAGQQQSNPQRNLESSHRPNRHWQTIAYRAVFLLVMAVSIRCETGGSRLKKSPLERVGEFLSVRAVARASPLDAPIAESETFRTAQRAPTGSW